MAYSRQMQDSNLYSFYFAPRGNRRMAVVVPNSYLRHKVWRGLNTDEAAEPNVFKPF